MSAVMQIARKEQMALLRNQRGLLWVLGFSGVLSAFALLLIGKALGLATGWALMYVLALPYPWSVGASGQNLAQAIG